MPQPNIANSRVPPTLIGLALLICACSGPANPPSLKISLSSPVGEQNAQYNVTGFDLYTDAGRLHAVFTAAGAQPKQPRIGYLHSEDGGAHWSPPQWLDTQFTQPVESKIGNDIQIAAAGDSLLIVWQTTGEIPGMGPLTAIHSSDGGQTWTQGTNPVGADGDQSHPDLLADAQGRFHLVWLDDREENGYQGLRYARTGDGLAWQAAQTLDDATCSCCWNRLAPSADAAINVLYRDNTPRDMALAQSTDGGERWRKLSSVGNFGWRFDGCPHNGGGLSASGPTLHAAVWTGAEQKAGLYYLQSADNGLTWSAPQAIAAGSGAFHADLAAREGGQITLAWDAPGAAASQVSISRSSDNGVTWSAPQILSGDNAANPRLAAVNNGWLALWTEQTAAGVRVWRSAQIH